MLLNGNTFKETTSDNNLTHLDQFLENNNTTTIAEQPWSKLDKTSKTQKLIAFANNIYKPKKKISIEEMEQLILYLKDCLDRKKLTRVKDVEYDKSSGEIIDIPSLFYNKTNKHFTLKNLDKRVSTLKSLPNKKLHLDNKTATVTAKSVDSVD